MLSTFWTVARSVMGPIFRSGRVLGSTSFGMGPIVRRVARQPEVGRPRKGSWRGAGGYQNRSI
jgi:hypothetical protein